MSAKSQSTEETEWVQVGAVGRPHGLQGAFFLKTADRTTEWGGYDRLYFETKDGKTAIKVKRTYLTGGMLAIVTDAFSKREDVEVNYGKPLFVQREEIEADDDEYVVKDLIGLEVWCAEKGLLGKVIAVGSFGAQTNLEIEMVANKKTVFFPFIEEFVLNVDSSQRRVEITYVPEFFED